MKSFETQPVPFKYRYHVDNFDEMDGSALQQAKEESSDGKNIRGRYSVRMPDGRLQVVTYSTGPDGYVANVHYENDFIRSGPSFLSDRDDNKKVAPQFTASVRPSYWDSDEMYQNHDSFKIKTDCSKGGWGWGWESVPTLALLPPPRLQLCQLKHVHPIIHSCIQNRYP